MKQLFGKKTQELPKEMHKLLNSIKETMAAAMFSENKRVKSYDHPSIPKVLDKK